MQSAPWIIDPPERSATNLGEKLGKLQAPAVELEDLMRLGRLGLRVGRWGGFDGCRGLSLSEGSLVRPSQKPTHGNGLHYLAVLAPPHKVCLTPAPAHLVVFLIGVRLEPFGEVRDLMDDLQSG